MWMTRIRGRLARQDAQAWVRDAVRVVVALIVLLLAAIVNSWLG